MMKTITFLAFAAAMFLCSPSPLLASDAVLVKATLSTHTNDEDKDWNTCIFVEVRTADNDLIAHGYNQDCSNADGSQYKDGSDHQFDLTIDSPGLERDLGKGFQVRMWQETHGGAGHDTWRFQATVSLQFSHGAPTLTASTGNIEFKSNGTGDRPTATFKNGN
jgi:hypothetical protein